MEAGFSRKFQRRRIKKNLSWLWTLEFAKKIRNIHVELKILRPWKFFLSFHDTVAIWSRANSTGKDIRPHLSIKGENVEDPSWHRSLRKEGGEIHRGGEDVGPNGLKIRIAMDGATPCCSQNGDRAAVVETQQVAILIPSCHRCFRKDSTIHDPPFSIWASSSWPEPTTP